MTTVYTWDEFGIYSGTLELDQSYADPLEPGVLNLPRNATRVWPPKAGEREAARILPDGKNWELIPDWRGFTYWRADRTKVTITKVGVEPEDGWLSADPGPSLDEARVLAHARLRSAYLSQIEADVTYTSSGGVTQVYQADQAFSVANLSQMLVAFQATQSVPAGFYWVSKDNTKVPFTYSDLQALAAAIGESGFQAYAHWQSKKVEVDEAETVDDVEEIEW